MISASTRIYLVRHGETHANLLDLVQGSSNDKTLNSLNEKGKAQAEEVAIKLSHLSFGAFYSSDLRRAKRTAKIIARWKNPDIKVKPTIDIRIRERDWGELCDGKITWADYDKNDEEYLKLAEDEAVFSTRALECLEEIGKQHLGQTVLVASHGGWIRNVLIQVFKLECKLNEIRLGNGGIVSLNYSEGRWILEEDCDGLKIPDAARGIYKA